MGVDKMGGGGGEKIVNFESPNSSATEKEIIERRARSLAVHIQREMHSQTLNSERLENAKNTWSGYEISDLERMIIVMPPDWIRNNPEQWLGLAEILQGKYAERERDQLP
jgi:hypothetical protein